MIGRIAMACVLAAVGCKGDPPNVERQLPNLHPTPGVTVPAGLRIPVDVPGQPARVIDRAFLDGTSPDFKDGDRTAWRLDRLLGLQPGDEVVAETAAGVRIGFPVTADRIPVLLLNRRGEVGVLSVAPDDPFPRFHGAGGRRGRPPGDVPHASDVTRIAVKPAAR
ncbi:MAG: hypothetical protein D6689_06560 [Deltaproteobacteria bacterium]|nr:MAG: hypothetical protein D6689_06560 [Deltaproteobacteria bacterium]